MDEPGLHARLRGARLDEAAAHPDAGNLHATGGTTGIATALPLNQARHSGKDAADPSPEEIQKLVKLPGQAEGTMGAYEVNSYRPPAWISSEEAPTQSPIQPPAPPHARSVSVMEPHLQMMLGPILAYHTVTDSEKGKVWNGAAMVVCCDDGSDYESLPILTLSYTNPGSLSGTDSSPSTPQTQTITATKIYTYHSPTGPQSFFRFPISILLPVGTTSMEVFHYLNKPSVASDTESQGGATGLSFWVPGSEENLRWAAHSCNGFSSGVDESAFFDKDKFDNGYDPLWTNVLQEHERKPFHCLVGGGDQVYCDGLSREPEMQPWVNSSNDQNRKLKFPLTDDMSFAIDRYYFNRYIQVFRMGAFGEAIGRIPMVNMLDDHDLIDGFGSYPDDLQSSPVFKTIGSRGYFWYLLFQLFTVDELDGTSIINPHPMSSMIIGGDGPWIPFPSHSLLVYLGPKVTMLLLDGRAERKKDQVVSKQTYDIIFTKLKALPQAVEQLVVQLGIPIAYPRMNFVEAALESKMNPLTVLSKHGMMPGFINKFNEEAELLDDLNDHWTATHHKAERNWLVEECQKLAVEKKLRISFLSGDVHAGAVGCFYTKPSRHDRVDPALDSKYMLNIITSAIVNTPPPAAVGTLVSTLGARRHKTLHHIDTDEEMIALFKEGPDGSARKMDTIMLSRNWTQVDYDTVSGDLQYQLMVEIIQGGGDTKAYPITSPAPRWA